MASTIIRRAQGYAARCCSINTALLRAAAVHSSTGGIDFPSFQPNNTVSGGFRPFSSRALQSKGGSKADKELFETLKNEIEFETNSDLNKIDYAADPPKPFTIETRPGYMDVILRRTYNNEDIAVACVYGVVEGEGGDEEEDQKSDEEKDQKSDESENDSEEEEDGTVEQLELVVTVAKGGDEPVLEINCTYAYDRLEIEKVLYLEQKLASPNLRAIHYDGPEFNTLDEELQAKFQNYLEARGINKDLCNFLISYMPCKERKEYLQWLKNVSSFVKK